MISRSRFFRLNVSNFGLSFCVRPKLFPLYLRLAIRQKRHRDFVFSIVATLLVVGDDLRLWVCHPLAEGPLEDVREHTSTVWRVIGLVHVTLLLWPSP